MSEFNSFCKGVWLASLIIDAGSEQTGTRNGKQKNGGTRSFCVPRWEERLRFGRSISPRAPGISFSGVRDRRRHDRRRGIHLRVILH